MNNIDVNEIKRAKVGWLGLIVILVIFLLLAAGIFMLSLKPGIENALGIRIMSYFCLGMATLILLSFIRQGIYIYRTVETLKIGNEAKCEFISACRVNKKNYHTGVFCIKVYYYNNRNEKKIFKTRPMYTPTEATHLEIRKTLTAKTHNNFLVIIEPPQPHIK